MRLRMLKLCVGKGRQVMKQLCLRYYTTVATEHAGYVLYRALVYETVTEVLLTLDKIEVQVACLHCMVLLCIQLDYMVVPGHFFLLSVWSPCYIVLLSRKKKKKDFHYWDSGERLGHMSTQNG